MYCIEIIKTEQRSLVLTINFQSINPGVVESEMTSGFHKQVPHLKGKDVAAAVKFILAQPPEVNVRKYNIQ